MDVDERTKLKCYQKFKDKEMIFESLGMKKKEAKIIIIIIIIRCKNKVFLRRSKTMEDCNFQLFGAMCLDFFLIKNK